MPLILGTGNRYITTDFVVKASLRLLTNSLVASKLANRTYEPNFGKVGGKLGDKVTIKKPYRVKSTAGRVASAAAPMIDQTTTFTIDRQQHVRLDFNSIDGTLSLENFAERYLGSAAAQLAHQVDLSVLEAAVYGGFHSSGSPGTAIVNNSFIDAVAQMEEIGVPQDGMVHGVLGPLDAAAVQKDVKGTSNEQIAMMAIERAYIANSRSQAGVPIYRTAQMPRHTTGARGGTPLVAGASQSGTTLNIDGLSNSVTGWGKRGDVFTIAGVFSINPQTYQSTGRLQQFVLTADVSSSGTGTATLSFLPEINSGAQNTTDGGGNNISSAGFQTVSALPADNAAITFLGNAATTYRQVVLMHKDAVSMACVDIMLPRTAKVAERAVDKDSGMALTLTGDWDGVNYVESYRLDVLWGTSAVYPELIHRIWSA